jgi:hypothetical protein
MPSTAFTATLGGLLLNQVRSNGFSANGEPAEGMTSGAVDVTDYFAGQVDFRAQFESDDIASVAAVSNVATAGIPVLSGTIAIPYQIRANLSTFGGSGDHYKLSGTNGLVVPTSFTLPAGGDATVALECVFLSADGDTIPVAVNTAQSLTAEAFQAKYSLGPVSVNGTVIPNVTNATVTPGIELQVQFYRFNYATDAFIVRRRPVIEITTHDLPTLSSLGAGWGTGTALVAYARKRSTTGFVADATAQHVKFSFADGVVKAVSGITGAGVGDNSTRTIRFVGESLTVTGGVAIT